MTCRTASTAGVRPVDFLLCTCSERAGCTHATNHRSTSLKGPSSVEWQLRRVSSNTVDLHNIVCRHEGGILATWLSSSCAGLLLLLLLLLLLGSLQLLPQLLDCALQALFLGACSLATACQSPFSTCRG